MDFHRLIPVVRSLARSQSRSQLHLGGQSVREPQNAYKKDLMLGELKLLLSLYHVACHFVRFRLVWIPDDNLYPTGYIGLYILALLVQNADPYE